MRGDLLFWTADGSIFSRLVCFATSGPFSHVSVDLGNNTDIGAHTDDGVQVLDLPSDRGITRWNPVTASASPVSNVLIENGIAFLLGEVGNGYGWCNILNNLLKLVHIPYRLSRLDRYDCSSLVTRYLTLLGIALGDLGEEPDSVSPNDLARWLGILK